jgi:CRISPR-associated protein Csy1
MQPNNPQRVAELRTIITDFLKKRLDNKLDGIKGDAEEDHKKREIERQKLTPAIWLEKAARRVNQIQLVTHVLKATHPDIKIKHATNLHIDPSNLKSFDVLGSHVLGKFFDSDITGDAAALDVYAFLTESYEGSTLLYLMKSGDSDLAQALSDDQAQANQWMQTFAAVDSPRCGKPSSHTLAKQIYWPVGNNPHNDANYHLLSPLYASALAHRVYMTLQDDRFSEAAKTAREAKKTDTFCERPVREYPHLAVQQIGGTQPQNISQLNSERRGNNCLLASLPPVWRSMDIKPLLKTESMLNNYERRPDVRNNIKALIAFLKTDPNPNSETRKRRATYVDGLIDEFLQFTAELRSLQPGWSQTAECQLSDAAVRWLDPEGAAQSDATLNRAPPTDTSERISDLFAKWLTAQLRKHFPAGDSEYLAWRNALQEEINAQEECDVL